MAFWIFKCNPDRYRLRDRLADPDPTITWTVTRFQDEINAGDTVFLWLTGLERGVKAVLRVDQAPTVMPELESEQRYWVERDTQVQLRVLCTITQRGANLSHTELRRIDGLQHLSVFEGFQQGTSFPVTPEQGAILVRLIERRSQR